MPVQNQGDLPHGFDREFAALTGLNPLSWQKRLFDQHFRSGNVPAALDLPTGLGKTSVMAIWLIARAHGAKLPRRLVYIVDRRAVVDQATTEAEKLRCALEGKGKHFDLSDDWDEDRRASAKETAAELAKNLGLNGRKLPISTLRGAHVDKREWLADPAATAIVVGTVDMIGSRLLFSGYGVSRKMRPYHAGLLGADVLVVLDEAHLVPPFAHLLRAIEQDPALRPAAEADRRLLPRFLVLPLSATQRDLGTAEPDRATFHLEEKDKADSVTKQRLEARKRLCLKLLAEKEPDKQLADAAWALGTKDGKFSRVAVFCDRRDKDEEGGGPSAQGVKAQLERLTAVDKKTGHAKIEIPVELLVGARRVHERERVEKSLRSLGFIGKKEPRAKPAFLVATSAGEVGIDIDADHVVMDLVSWERMVQRLGRVNRRGEGDATVEVFWTTPAIKDADAPTEAEKRALIAFSSKALIEKLPQIAGAFDASPAALRELAERAQADAALKKLIEAATTAEPLRPALNRALVDAWSMTSLEIHTGRPNVGPWLRGWLEEIPQTTVIWRTYLPVRLDDRERTISPRTKDKQDIADFFEAAPPHESEKLETETYRVVSWLRARGTALLKGKARQTPKEAETDREVAIAEVQASAGNDGDARQVAPKAKKFEHDDIVALILSRSIEYEGCLTLGDLVQERKGKEKEQFEDRFFGKILAVDVTLGGLKDGLLDEECCGHSPEAADSLPDWNEKAGFRVRRDESREGRDPDWRFEDAFALRRNDEGTILEWLVVEHYREVAQKEDSRSISRPQTLAVHQDMARSEILRIAKSIGLADAAAGILAVGAGLHDEGKRAARWQRAFNAPRDAKKYGLSGPLAKTHGPIDQAILGGYRHEFGSLLHIEKNAEFEALPDEWRELALHLVAAHHGGARPVIETRGCEDGPPSLLEERARAVGLRFVRLQKRWGPWGLAWWEALLRAADQQASRQNEQTDTPSKRPAMERV